jgi:hypothetical protein
MACTLRFIGRGINFFLTYITYIYIYLLHMLFLGRFGQLIAYQLLARANPVLQVLHLTHKIYRCQLYRSYRNYFTCTLVNWSYIRKQRFSWFLHCNCTLAKSIGTDTTYLSIACSATRKARRNGWRNLLMLRRLTHRRTTCTAFFKFIRKTFKI